MSRSRGDWPKTLIREKFPFQVVLYLTDDHRANVQQLICSRERLGGYRLDGSVYANGCYFTIFQLPTPEAQKEFIELYGGIPHNALDKNSRPWETYFDNASHDIPKPG